MPFPTSLPVNGSLLKGRADLDVYFNEKITVNDFVLLCGELPVKYGFHFKAVCFLPVFEALFLSLPGELSGVGAVLRQ